ncbi:MAG: T9SS type A sorting domain-containing protein [Bacteroidia bacterium]|nr:T9SS type A sorting domain-containing protein [Bacteroidia bacterium]
MKWILIFLSLGWYSYTASQSLNFDWVVTFGSQAQDRGEFIALDDSGNSYVTGWFTDTIQFGNDVFDLSTQISAYNSFVLKLDPEGKVVWAKALASVGAPPGLSQSLGIHIDPLGDVLVVGEFANDIDFDPGSGSNIVSALGVDFFILKLDASGDFKWVKTYSGTSFLNRSYSVTTDKFANIYTVGFFHDSVDFDPGPSTFMLRSDGGRDCFVQKLDPSGDFLWAKAYGGPGNEGLYSISGVNDSVFYLTGSFSDSVDFDPGPSEHLLYSESSESAYVLKLDQDGNFRWASSIQGNGFSYAFSVNADRFENALVSGWFQDTVDFDPGFASYPIAMESQFFDMFVWKLDKNGDFVWAKNIGGGLIAQGESISSDLQDNVYVTGYYLGTTDFDPGPAVVERTNNGAFILSLDVNGDFVWLTTLESSNYAEGETIVFDANGQDVFVTGHFIDTLYADTAFSNNVYPGEGDRDIFVLKYTDEMVAIPTLEEHASVSVFPNPTAGFLHFKHGNYQKDFTLRISDQQGRILRKYGPAEVKHHIEFDHPPGIYFATFSSGGLVKTVKFVIAR